MDTTRASAGLSRSLLRGNRDCARTSEQLRDKPAGTIRITTIEHAADTILLPKLAEFLPKYPDVTVEIAVEYGLTDVVAERYDAGIRSGEQVAKDMIAVCIGPDLRIALVGASSYFEKRRPPATPQDLPEHACINLRLPTHGGLYAWELEKDGRELRVRVDGPLIVNGAGQMLISARAGLGLAYSPEELVAAGIESGTLTRVLEDWCPPYSGYHLYYPSRRPPSATFSLLVYALRYRG